MRVGAQDSIIAKRTTMILCFIVCTGRTENLGVNYTMLTRTLRAGCHEIPVPTAARATWSSGKCNYYCP